MRISGTTRLIAHIGFPTESFKAPLIYNPYFAARGIDAVVVPHGCKADDFPAFLRIVSRLSNFHGALITMPHKVTTLDLLDDASTAARIAGACNAVRLDAAGRLVGDMFDGEGFVRGVRNKGHRLEGARALVIGCGGVGSAIAASLAASHVGSLGLFDSNAASMHALAARLAHHYRSLAIMTGSNDATGWDIVVNATPLGLSASDPLPVDPDHLAPTTFVGEVVMSREETPLLAAARARGCATQIGLDMLFEQIPAYLEFFDFPTATPDELRYLAQV